jgi:hypothetical protein
MRVEFGFARNATFVLQFVAVCAAGSFFGLCLQGDDEVQLSRHLKKEKAVHALPPSLLRLRDREDG